MRLRRSDLASPGLRRRRRGKGFEYLAPDGAPVTDPEVTERIRGLAIPPAWRKVWICPYPNGHIQAIGYDDAGRRQYLYHQEWRRARDEEKHDRVLGLAKYLPDFRARLETDLTERGLGRQRVLAAALRMIDRGVFRVGNEEYVAENGSHGAATLLREHVRISGGEIRFRFPAKSGMEAALRMRDPVLAPVLTSLRRARTGEDRLLCYRDGAGWHHVHAEDVNERFKELTEPEFTVKDLRTWNATVLAAVAFAGIPRPTSQRAFKRAMASVMREVADELGNTPAVARRSYVDPRVVRAFEQGRTISAAVRKVGAPEELDDERRQVLESAVARLVKRTS